MGPMRIALAAACFALASLASFASQAAGTLPGFDELEGSLRLDRAQKAQFDAAVAATPRGPLSVALGGLELQARIAEERAKSKSDLDALPPAPEEGVGASRTHFREARAAGEGVCAPLDPCQGRRVKRFVEGKLRQLERVAESVRGLLGESPGR